MIYMVIEHFRDGAAAKIYDRVARHGRLIPHGLHYVASWVDMDFKRCFQVMETDTPALLNEWVQGWADLVDFEIIPVRSASEAANMMANRPD